MNDKIKHSPTPFFATFGPSSAVIRDAWGDSIAAMAYATGDHPQEEQKANCSLFLASAELLAAAKLMLQAYEQLIPGLKHISVKDYNLVMVAAPQAAREAIAAAEGGAVEECLAPPAPAKPPGAESASCGDCGEPHDRYICDDCSTVYCGCGPSCDCGEVT